VNPSNLSHLFFGPRTSVRSKDCDTGRVKSITALFDCITGENAAAYEMPRIYQEAIVARVPILDPLKATKHHGKHSRAPSWHARGIEPLAVDHTRAVNNPRN